MKPPALENWLREHLRTHNLTQQQLAAQTGIAVSTISRMMHGQTPGPDIIIALADFFGKDADALLESAGVLSLSALPDGLPPELKGLASRLFRLPKSEHQAIQRQMEALLELLESGWTLQAPDEPDGGAPAGSRLIAVSVRL